MQAYILFTSPALFIIAAAFWYMLADYRKTHKPKWLFSLLMILLIVLPIRYTIERVKPFTQRDRNPQWVTDLRKLDNNEIENGVLFNYNRPIEAMFYTNLTAYSQIPERKVITDLLDQGYTVIIADNGQIPADFYSIDGMIIKRLTFDTED